MPTSPQPSRTSLIAGRILSWFAILFLLLDGVLRTVRFEPYVTGLTDMGYPGTLAVPIGILLIVFTVLYAIPRTSVLGAILVTAYLGGAASAHIRILEINYITAIVVGLMIWGGLYLRMPALRAFIPFIQPENQS